MSRPGAALDAHVVVAHAGLDVRLAAEPGAVLAVMGPSGSGKTTLLEAIAGLTRLDGGAIVLGDTELAGPSRHLSPSHRSVGLLGQDALLFPHLSAAQNIGFAARIAGADRARARAVAADWLDRIGLAGLGGRLAGPDRPGRPRRAS
ncbi:ATP-binding cassette domain-containing protein [Mycolicibacterium fallax]|uniref:ATP-binding cassette domain-containing protein n=1 Tax=Mycolicibacterium fallax TaxID=1793 RepID=UPI0021F32338|nr:ATP-binding cassette domain-containing protein [Mycolicibacterium fallax]